MTRPRPGQDGRPSSAARMPPPARLLWLLLLLPVGVSCAPGDAATRGLAGAPVADDSRALAPPAGRAAGVEALCWGGPPADRRLGALFADGRFAVYRPQAGPSPASVGLVAPDRGRQFTGLALSAADRAVSGDALGLVLWDTSEPIARPIDRLDCGPVGALAIEPIGPGDLLAGLEDGRLLRLRPDRDALGSPRDELRSSGRAPGIRALEFVDGGRSLLVFRTDGRVERRSRSLDLPSEPIGPAEAAAEARGGIVRVLGPRDDGPALEAIGPDGSPRWRFPLPADGVGLAAVLGGDGLVVACNGRVLLLRMPLDGSPLPSEVRGLPAEGSSRVAADPADPDGRRVALADAAGRLLVYDAEDLARSAAPIHPDNAADLAFRLDRRAYHPRPGRGSDGLASDRLASRIAEVRRRLDRGDPDGLLAAVRSLEDDPALDRDAAAEVATLSAAVGQRFSWADSAIRLPLASARETFALRGWRDREADLSLWSGSVLLPPFDGRDDPGDPLLLEEALAECRRAAEGYRASGPGLERQAKVAEAMASWGLLALGRRAEAQRAFAPVERWVAADPVLRQAPELDRIASALAVSRLDWEAADLASDRLLRRLSPPGTDREPMAREAALERVGVLAALGRWAEASRVLEPDRPDDPEWTLRRGTVRRLAGIDSAPVDPSPPDGPTDSPGTAAIAHLRGRLAVSRDDTRPAGVELLARASQAHRRAGRPDLATEADLERAEALERLGRIDEAIDLFARVARTLGPDPHRSRSRGASRPIAFATGRARRGLARCQLARGRPDHALGALEEAGLIFWFDRQGEALVRSSVLATGREGATASLRAEARRAAFVPPGLAGADTDAAAAVRRLELRLSAEHRELALADPTRPIDRSSIDLGPDEAVLVLASAGPESIVGFLLRPGRPTVSRILPARRSDLRRAARLWRAALGDSGRPTELEPSPSPAVLLSIAPEPDLPEPAPPPDDDRAPGRVLLDSALGPFLGDLGGVGQLTVIPDDALAAVPIDALATGADAPNLPAIRLAPSLAVLRRSRTLGRSDPEPGSSVVVSPAGDLVSALAVRSAYGADGRRVEVVAEPEGLPSRLIGAGGAPAVLHIRGPAALDPAATSSGSADLILDDDSSPEADPSAPRLTCSDVLGLDLRGAVVVLDLSHRPLPASCPPTAWRDLSSCWLAAGAGAVLISLWDLPADSSPAFVAELHRGLSRGLPPDQALAIARRALASRPETADPVHWAGIVLYDPGPPGR
ncbi:CHAT domain-containing protein [Tautonia sociabilis]|uniref:CHAT domain-containing protein n=1 Tax=Tautonia sociabilis TaxID=2080755 RepID=A0A432MQW7_9BACT|nr:CHAT domain-containing protein [Tautonia sociabilis]RUL89770.1 CHAT domain-containing protein [Tautonia sociabilis]